MGIVRGIDYDVAFRVAMDQAGQVGILLVPLQTRGQAEKGLLAVPDDAQVRSTQFQQRDRKNAEPASAENDRSPACLANDCQGLLQGSEEGFARRPETVVGVAETDPDRDRIGLRQGGPKLGQGVAG